VTTNDLAEPIEAIPVETTPGNPAVTVVAWVAVVAAVVVLGFWVWTRWIDPSVGGTIDRYVHGTGGVEFADPTTAQFRVTTPTQWATSSTSGALGPTAHVTDAPGGGYEFSVTKTPQPVTALESYQQGLNRLAGQLASDAHAEIVHQDGPLPFGDVVYKFVTYRRGGTYWRAQLALLKDRLYTLIVKAPNEDKAPYTRMVKSFQILGPR
jgi:hypothetical protein